jgi:hypothetical protein
MACDAARGDARGQQTQEVVEMKQATRPNRPVKVPTPKPSHAYEDIPWRMGWRVRRFLMHIWGPPDLGDAHNPLGDLARERAARYAGRTRQA